MSAPCGICGVLVRVTEVYTCRLFHTSRCPNRNVPPDSEYHYAHAVCLPCRKHFGLLQLLPKGPCVARDEIPDADVTMMMLARQS